MKRFAILAIFSACLLLGTAHAAEPYVTIADVDEKPGKLDLTISAVGSDGKPMTNLTAENIGVTLNGTQIAVGDVATRVAEHVPTAVLIAVDVSGSMQGDAIVQARQSTQAFIDSLDPADQVGITSFSTSVSLVQDFTTDRDVLRAAVARLTPLGDTALYDAVIDANRRIGAVAAERKIVVLLSDGQATVGLNRRAESLEAARTGNANLVMVGLGTEIDRTYMTDLAKAAGARIVEAPTPAALRQLYTDLATTIRSQFILSINVPSSIDRTQPMQINLKVAARTGTATAERALPPLEGAAPPPFDLKAQGVLPGQRVGADATVQPVLAEGSGIVRVEYWLDGELAATADQAPFAYQLSPVAMLKGNHLLRMVAFDERGGRGETQVPFKTGPAPAGFLGSSGKVLLMILLLPIVLGLAVVVINKQKGHRAARVARVKPWAIRDVEPASGVEGWPEPPPSLTPPPPQPAVDRLLGRLIVMNEADMRNADFTTMREYELRATPLVFGTGAHCDVQVKDDTGRIAAEEARIWVQRSRLIYHKLTTLSAMATEGVTSGWEFLQSGEELSIGDYRLVFQIAEEEQSRMNEAQLKAEAEVFERRLAQEHGMGLREMWQQMPEDPPLHPNT